ncbi:MAG TPA: chaperone NapD [Dokdonella sp.]|uniref:chaperone NapD n=1 Tax=Dokdonella sp. TaxID=2291710 RepID=UPI002BC20F6D|nr:chaperone NapD [Dokdonella sp.]HUD41012.1 chaperone NapD [Dokdonella sp.]
MDEEIHIASIVVRHRPDAAASIDRLVAAMPGAEVATREAGRCIVLHEGEGTRDMLACIEAIQATRGVISASLVYHHAEARAALDDILQPAAHEDDPR